MRLVAWNCNMALHRKMDALLELEPDVAVVSECARPERLRQKLPDADVIGGITWVGRNPNKGLAIITFNGYSAGLMDQYDPDLEWVAPVHIEGEISFTLLAVWALNLSGGNYRKDQPGPFRISLDRYVDLFADRPMAVAGDLNNNAIWDRPGWPINHVDAVEILGERGLASVYHETTGEQQGQERTPTIYWRDRSETGPTYHLDYIFLPTQWLQNIREFEVGTFSDWCGSGLSDHVPLVVDVRL